MDTKKEIEKLNSEKTNLLIKIQLLDQQKGQMITRIAEIQGIIKYLQDKEGKKKEAK